MKLRKLARLCVHDRMEQHQTDTGDLSKPFSFTICPGGVFLPDDTLIIEKVDGEWPDWIEVLPDLDGSESVRYEKTPIREPDPNQAEIPFTNSSGLW